LVYFTSEFNLDYFPDQMQTIRLEKIQFSSLKAFTGAAIKHGHYAEMYRALDLTIAHAQLLSDIFGVGFEFAVNARLTPGDYLFVIDSLHSKNLDASKIYLVSVSASHQEH
jgi:hypothetical protein